MRIVYYTHTAFFDVALSLARALARRVELHLILEMTPQTWRQSLFDAAPRDLPEGLIPADPIIGEAFPPGVRASWSDAASFQLAVHAHPRSLGRRSFRISREVVRFVESLPADIFHVDDVDVTPRLPLALRTLRQVPLVLNVHDPDPHSSERSWRKSLSRRLSFPVADRFVLFNESQRPAFSRRPDIDPARVSVARLGTYEIFRHWDAASPVDGPPIVLFFGRLSEYKGLDTFLTAMTTLSEHVPDLRVVIAGRPVGGYTVPPLPLLQRGGSIDLIERYIDNAEVSRLFRRAAVVVCPYHDATQSGIVLTALGFLVPVVATRVGGIPEYVEDGVTGALVPARDPDALASAVERILTDPDHAAHLREGIERIQRSDLNWDRMAADLVKIYADTARPG